MVAPSFHSHLQKKMALFWGSHACCASNIPEMRDVGMGWRLPLSNESRGPLRWLGWRFVEAVAASIELGWGGVEAVAVTIEHERHEARAENYAEDDTEYHSHIAGNRYSHVGEVPTYTRDVDCRGE